MIELPAGKYSAKLLLAILSESTSVEDSLRIIEEHGVEHFEVPEIFGEDFIPETPDSPVTPMTSPEPSEPERGLTPPPLELAESALLECGLPEGLARGFRMRRAFEKRRQGPEVVDLTEEPDTPPPPVRRTRRKTTRTGRYQEDASGDEDPDYEE